jgi:hypothetical protein
MLLLALGVGIALIIECPNKWIAVCAASFIWSVPAFMYLSDVIMRVQNELLEKTIQIIVIGVPILVTIITLLGYLIQKVVVLFS